MEGAVGFLILTSVVGWSPDFDNKLFSQDSWCSGLILSERIESFCHAQLILFVQEIYYVQENYLFEVGQ